MGQRGPHPKVQAPTRGHRRTRRSDPRWRRQVRERGPVVVPSRTSVPVSTALDRLAPPERTSGVVSPSLPSRLGVGDPEIAGLRTGIRHASGCITLRGAVAVSDDPIEAGTETEQADTDEGTRSVRHRRMAHRYCQYRSDEHRSDAPRLDQRCGPVSTVGTRRNVRLESFTTTFAGCALSVEDRDCPVVSRGISHPPWIPPRDTEGVVM